MLHKPRVHGPYITLMLHAPRVHAPHPTPMLLHRTYHLPADHPCACSLPAFDPCAVSTWGFHRPPLYDESGSSTCRTSREAILAERGQEAHRKWSAQGNYGMFSNYNGVNTWSTNDRVMDLYRQYI